MPRKGIFFYGTKIDMEPGLGRLEEIIEIKYVLAGLFDSPSAVSYATYRDIPDLGISLKGDKVHMPTYMLMHKNESVNIREVPQRRGGVKYAIDGCKNNALLFFKPSGEFKKAFLIPGEFAPGNTESSLEVYSLFRKHFIKGFAAIKSFRVGPEATDMLDRGIPLTPSHRVDPVMYLRR